MRQHVEKHVLKFVNIGKFYVDRIYICFKCFVQSLCFIELKNDEKCLQILYGGFSQRPYWS